MVIIHVNSKTMLVTSVLPLFSFLLLLLVVPVASFHSGWSTHLAPSDEHTHYSLTECALVELGRDYLTRVHQISIDGDSGQCQIKSLSKAIEGHLNRLKIDQRRWTSSIESISENNVKQDLVEIFNPATHFDNEAFNDGATLVSRRFDAAVSSAQIDDYHQARASFGALLHTVQDFYSHSNWIELGHRVPNNGMGKYQVLGQYATPSMRTCVDCQGNACRDNLLPSIIKNNLLTSGFFELRDNTSSAGVTKKPLGKCSHGGSIDLSVSGDARGGGINKDSLDSDHGHLHQIAGSVALNATKQMLEQLWMKIGDGPFGHFLGLSTSLRSRSLGSVVFVIDTSGSMGPYIDMAKQLATNLAKMYQTRAYQPMNYILSAYNDPHWGPLTVSPTCELFTSEISKLRARGGGDEPELFYHGIIAALQQCEMGSTVFVFTDGPAKDHDLKGVALRLATEKRVTIHVLYGKGNYQEDLARPSAVDLDSGIEYLDSMENNGLSWLTGGMTVPIDPQPPSLNATENYIVQRLDMSRLQRLVLGQGLTTNVVFNVDSSISSLHIEVTSLRPLSRVDFDLNKPPSTTSFPYPATFATPFLRVYRIAVGRGDVGTWNLLLSTATEHTINVNAVSGLACSSRLQKRVRRSSSSNSCTLLTSPPVRGERDLFLLTTCENLPSSLRAARVDLIDANNASHVLQTLQPISLFPTGFVSQLTVPMVAFRLSAVIELMNGEIVQRQENQLISPTSISVTIDNQPLSVLQNEKLTLSCSIENHDERPATVVVRVNDTLGLLGTKGVRRTVTIPGLSQWKETVALDTTRINGNASIVTDSFIVSVTSWNNVCHELAPVLIQRRAVALTNQSDYQLPSVINAASTAISGNLFIRGILSLTSALLLLLLPLGINQ